MGIAVGPGRSWFGGSSKVSVRKGIGKTGSDSGNFSRIHSGWLVFRPISENYQNINKHKSEISTRLEIVTKPYQKWPISEY